MTYKQFTRERPMMSVREAPPRMTRAELEAAVRGYPAAGPHTAEAIDRICWDQAALDRIATRAADGTSRPEDGLDQKTCEDRISHGLRRLGLYPAAVVDAVS